MMPDTTLAFREFLSNLSEHAPRMVMTLPYAAHDADIVAIEQQIGHSLPVGLKALYGVHNGESRGEGSRPMFKTPLFRQTEFICLRGLHGVEGALAQVKHLNVRWIPFASNNAGSWHGIYPDDDAEHPGAVVFWDMATGERVVAPDMNHFLSSLAKKLKRKRWKVNDDEIQTITAKIYASECLPLHSMIPHPVLVDKQIYLTRHNVEQDALKELLEDLPATPQSNDTWCFVIESECDISSVQIAWRGIEAHQPVYPCRSMYSIKRVNGRSQRIYHCTASVLPMDKLYMEVCIEFQ